MSYYNLTKDDYDAYLASPYWRKRIQPQVLERDNHTCQMCGARQRLEVHHTSYSQFRELCIDETIDHLVTLCGTCHKQVHQFYNDMQRGAEYVADDYVKQRWGALSKNSEQFSAYLHGLFCFDPDHSPADYWASQHGGESYTNTLNMAYFEPKATTRQIEYVKSIPNLQIANPELIPKKTMQKLIGMLKSNHNQPPPDFNLQDFLEESP